MTAASGLEHPAPISGAAYSAMELMPGDREVLVLDQRLLPREERYTRMRKVEEVAVAIETLAVRGAPAIGIAAAYGLVLAAAEAPVVPAHFRAAMSAAAVRLHRTRPTAVNLAWALGRMGHVVIEVTGLTPEERLSRLAAEARRIHREDVEACRAMGRIGARHVPDDAVVLTHCNAGALATGGVGTALGVIRAAREGGKRVKVIACETRPVLQGARLTAWELARDGFDVTVITDSMVAQRMRRGGIHMVVVGADRIARSGDVANKIGTYGVACLAKAHDIPFYVAAPWSTVDLACPTGDAIPIEERSEREMRLFGESLVAPEEAHVENPAFDVTPARLVKAIFTERGEVAPPSEASLRALA
ncbi:MAG TPA: S-methyl-5-thioribose-1-phosphate isomerase [Polyangiaceae bacterium]|nr:S-methyl-5-thioribose-1-phosphate isomerase [Polyangiaceae bacterium]